RLGYAPAFRGWTAATDVDAAEGGLTFVKGKPRARMVSPTRADMTFGLQCILLSPDSARRDVAGTAGGQGARTLPRNRRACISAVIDADGSRRYTPACAS